MRPMKTTSRQSSWRQCNCVLVVLVLGCLGRRMLPRSAHPKKSALRSKYLLAVMLLLCSFTSAANNTRCLYIYIYVFALSAACHTTTQEDGRLSDGLYLFTIDSSKMCAQWNRIHSVVVYKRLLRLQPYCFTENGYVYTDLQK